MPSAKIGDIYGELRIKLNKLQQDLNQSSQKFASWKQKNSNQLQQLASWAKRAEMAIAAIIIASTKLAVDFDRNMREVNTLINLNKEGFDDLKQSVIDLSKELGKDAAQMTEALYQVISAGQRGEDAMRTLEAGVKMAIGGIADQTVSVDALTTVMNAWGLTAEHVNDITDTFFTTVKLGKTTIGELAPAIGRVATSAAQAGVSFEEVGAAISALTVVGISTDEAVTGLNQMLMALIKPSDEARETAKVLGLEFSTQAVQAKGLSGFLDDLREKTGGSQEALAKLFPNIRAIKAILPLTTNASEQFSNALGIMAKDTGAAQIAFEEMEESYGRRLERLRVQFKNMGIELGERLMPSLESVIAILQEPDTLEAFAGLATGIVELAEAITKVIVGFNKFGEMLGTGLSVVAVEQQIKSLTQEAMRLETEFMMGLRTQEEYEEKAGYLAEQIRTLNEILDTGAGILNTDVKKKKASKTATDDLTDSTKKAKKPFEDLNDILSNLNENTGEAVEKMNDLALETSIWQFEQVNLQELKEEMRGYINGLKDIKDENNDIKISAEEVAQSFRELFGTYVKEGGGALAMTKRITGQLIRMQLFSKLGWQGQLAAGIMQVFGFQEGGIIPKGMPILNMAVYNENPKRPETAFKTPGGNTAVIPWDKMPQMVKAEVYVTNANPDTQVRAIIKANPDVMDELWRSGIRPAMVRDDRR